MTEHDLQNEIRNALAGKCLLFRANSGTGWTGSSITRLANGDMLIKNPRPFHGTPKGFSDLFGVQKITITQDMVGQEIGQFLAMEIKTKTGKLTDLQRNFLSAVQKNGGKSSVIRSTAEALSLLEKHDANN
jgi:hypothetical protein